MARDRRPPMGTLRLEAGAPATSSRTSRSTIARERCSASRGCSAACRPASAMCPPSSSSLAQRGRDRRVGAGTVEHVAGIDGRDRRLGRVGLGVDQQVAGVDRPDPVHEAVVRLAGQRPAPVGQAVDEHHPPQGMRAVEAMREEVRGPLEELLVIPRGRQRGVAHVRRDVEVRVGLPLRPAQASRARLREALAVARKAVEARVEVGPDILEGRRPAGRQRLEHHHAADVHVGALVELLELEERRVEGGELVRHPGNHASPVPVPQRPRGLLFSRRRNYGHDRTSLPGRTRLPGRARCHRGGGPEAVDRARSLAARARTRAGS